VEIKLKKGSSIIELVVVIGLISLLALAMSAIMLTTIISSNRVRRLTQIKQAGDLALTQIQTLIRNSRSIELCDATNYILTTVNPDGGLTTLLTETVGNTVRIASNSGTYLTPEHLTVNTFRITCEPNINPTFFKVSFDVTHAEGSGNDRENATLHFETTTSIRND
jgi:type II secretory pathway pseudopilin PulG